MKTKKNLWAAAAVLSAAMLLGGCGGSEPTKEAGEMEKIETTEGTEKTEGAEKVETGETETQTQPEETKEAEQEKVGISAAYPYIFSEGYAWVQLEDANQMAVVNTDGKIQFTLDISDAEGAFDVNVTPFYDGASAVYNYSNVLLSSFGYAIYNTAGELLSSSDDGDDSTDIKLIAGGDGMYLILKHTATFSENSTVLYCIDKNGNKLTDEMAVDDNIALTYIYIPSLQYLRDGFFGDGDVPYMYIADGKLHVLGQEETVTECVDMYFRGRGIDMVTCEFMSPLSWPLAFLSGTAENAVEMENADKMSQKISSINKDGIGAGWYDRNMDLVIPIPTFPEGVHVSAIENFSGGFAPIWLTGADGKSYATIVDETGNLAYEPVSGFKPDRYICKDGVLVGTDETGSLRIIDKDGTLMDPSGDISAFTGSINCWRLTINEGFKCIDGVFSRLDGTPFDQAVIDDNTVHVQLRVIKNKDS